MENSRVPRTPFCGAATELVAPVSNNIAHTEVHLNSSLARTYGLQSDYFHSQ